MGCIIQETNEEPRAVVRGACVERTQLRCRGDDAPGLRPHVLVMTGQVGLILMMGQGVFCFDGVSVEMAFSSHF